MTTPHSTVSTHTRRAHTVRHVLSLCLIAIVGFAASIVAHELFHLLIHWGDITALHIFPNADTIASITSTETSSTDAAMLEELMAYTVTASVMILTISWLYHLHDRHDRHSIHSVLKLDRARHTIQEIEKMLRG